MVEAVEVISARRKDGGGRGGAAAGASPPGGAPRPRAPRPAPAHCQVQCQGHARASATARRNAGAAGDAAGPPSVPRRRRCTSHRDTQYRYPTSKLIQSTTKIRLSNALWSFQVTRNASVLSCDRIASCRKSAGEHHVHFSGARPVPDMQ